MKTRMFGVVTLCLSLISIQTYTHGAGSAGRGGSIPAVPAPTAFEVVSVGANHRTWQSKSYEVGPDGKTIVHIHQIKELAGGLNYRDKSGNWIPSREIIEPSPNGAVANQGQYSVSFANNLNSEGAIDMRTTDGKRLRSNIIGLAYYDASTGTNVLIAQIQDSQGELIGDNQVLYPSALAGSGVKADVRYTYKKGGFEQDVILRTQLPDPETFGLNPETTEVMVMTEFLNPPLTSIASRQGDNEEMDEDISWGATRIGQGRAFDMGDSQNASSPANRQTVRKQFITLLGRHILFEKIHLPDIRTSLSLLPKQANNVFKLPSNLAKNIILPPTPLALAARHPMGLAVGRSSHQGYVLDYVQINSAETNLTFQGDTTYFVSAPISLYGTTTFEGGAVIKLNGSGEIDFDPNAAIICKTAAYRPALFTSVNDNTVGEPPSGSTGSPQVGDVNVFLGVYQTNILIHDLRFSYCANAVTQVPSTGTMDIWDCQFINTDYAINGYNMGLHNVLISTAATYPAIYAYGNLVGENVTVNGFAFAHSRSSVAFALTNCILTCQQLFTGTPPTFITNSTVWLPSPTTPVYEIAGAGSYYLTNGSPYRGAGTTNISLTLLAELANKTTYPPVVFDHATFATAANLSQQVPRDNAGTPDLGYHYDPLDYAFGGSDLYSTMTVSNGVEVAYFEEYGAATYEPYGLSLNDGADIIFSGTATAPCWFVNDNMVMEGGNGNWTARGWMSGMMFNGSGASPFPRINAHFAKFVTLASNVGPCRDNWAAGVGYLNDCEFYNAGMGCMWPSYYYTNCLFVRAGTAYFSQVDAESFSYVNCTFFGGCIASARYNGQSPSLWLAQNNSFDGTAFAWDDNLHGDTNYTAFDFNAYNTNNVSWQSYPYPYPPIYGTLEDSGPHDMPTTDYNWQSGRFGDYYLPPASPLVDAGNTTADALGLFHFTTQTNNVKEAASPVDIGYHYVAVDGYGNPIDSNGDGIPDYLEDLNGNGLADPGERPFGVTIDFPINGSVF